MFNLKFKMKNLTYQTDYDRICKNMRKERHSDETLYMT